MIHKERRPTSFGGAFGDCVLLFVGLTEFLKKFLAEGFFLFIGQIFNLNRFLARGLTNIPNKKNNIARKKQEQRNDKGRKIDVRRILSKISEETTLRYDVLDVFANDVR